MVAALLAHLAQTGQDLLQNDWAQHAAIAARFGNRVSVHVGGGRVGVRYDYDDGRRDRLWLASFRKEPETSRSI